MNFERLLKLRAVVARIGEMDLAKWWNTHGQMGRLGTAALRRGFPRTHYFAQARSTFAVAAQRCKELFDPPGCVTLWQLPESVEEEFDERWEDWLDAPSQWQSFFEQLESPKSPDLVAALLAFELVSDRDIREYEKLRRSSEGRSTQIAGLYSGTDDDVSLLALGFGRGEPGALVVPYARRANT